MFMIFFLLQWLHSVGLSIPSSFLNISTRMLLAALTALLLTIVIGPKFICKLYALKIGQMVRKEECPQLYELHKKKKETPTMGGVLILFSVVIALLLWMDLQSSFTLILLVSTLFLGLIGGWDDYLKLKYRNSKGLSGKKKLLLQLLLASAISLYLLCPAFAESIHVGKWFNPPFARDFSSSATAPTLPLQDYSLLYFLPFLKEPIWILGGAAAILAFLFTLVVIVGSSNAVNLTDGLDGLAAGSVVMVSLVFAVVAFLSNNSELSRYLHILYIEGSGEIAVFLAALVGASLGFLWFNCYPAQIFMGDVGSLSLGGILGVCAVLLRREFLLAIVGGIFVAEALSVIIQVASYKLRNKKRVFLCSPLHHHFEYKGWTENKVVMRFWIIGFILAIIGIASFKMQ